MDQGKIGRLIASLRSEAGMTQEALGEKLGVTNKTVSRWENGNYMPDISTMQALCGLFGISLNELLSGQRIQDKDFRTQADAVLLEMLRENPFVFQKRWQKEHTLELTVNMLAYVGFIVLGILADIPAATILGIICALAYSVTTVLRIRAYVKAKVRRPCDEE